MARVEIYSDGAAMNNGKPGAIGYAAVILTPQDTGHGHTGGEWMEPVSSSNVAELKAMLLGLRAVSREGRRGTDVLLFSDSEWSVKTIRGEYQASTNLDLIQQARAELRTFRSHEINWVRGHCGHKYNEQAHRLANHAAKRAQRQYEEAQREKEQASRCQDGLATPPPPPSIPGNASKPSPRLVMPKRPPVSKALGQARLDVIMFPCFAWNRENCKWQARYADAETWSVEAMMERRSKLLRDVAELESLVKTPPVGWDGIFFTEMYERLQGWKGHLNAIDKALDNRGRIASRPASTSASWSVGRKPSTSTAAPALAPSDDPFQWE